MKRNVRQGMLKVGLGVQETDIKVLHFLII